MFIVTAPVSVEVKSIIAPLDRVHVMAPVAVADVCRVVANWRPVIALVAVMMLKV
jgi:histidine ammonia-lyase